MKADCIGYTLRSKCLLKNIDEKIQGTGRRGRKRKQLLDDLKERRRCGNLEEEALVGTE
jgi:hypothetical protein